jgi:hypothetical protein
LLFAATALIFVLYAQGLVRGALPMQKHFANYVLKFVRHVPQSVKTCLNMSVAKHVQPHVKNVQQLALLNYFTKRQVISPAFFKQKYMQANDNLCLKKSIVTTLTCLFGCTSGNWATLAFFQAKDMQAMGAGHNGMVMDMHVAAPHHQLNMYYMIGVAMLVGFATCVIVVAAITKYQLPISWKGAFITAVNMSFISMLLMATEYAVRIILQPHSNIMAAMHSLDYFRDTKSTAISLLALAAAFSAVLPYNYYKLKKTGKACH